MGPRDRPHLTPQRLPPPFAATPHSVTKRRVPLGGTQQSLVADRVVQFARELVALAELACSMSRMRALAW